MSQVKPVPAGFGTVTPVLNIKGADAAIEFYKKAFGAEEKARMLGPGGAIMYAEIRIGDSAIMLGEAVMNPATQSSTHLFVADADAAWKRAVDAGATVAMPLADQFWGDRYGVLVDAWGNRWAIATHKVDMTPDQMQKAGDDFMKTFAK
ncbi:MAG: glyoxalase [Myxococcales bacterium]|nr:glyoxalase [Myxococcales bacterium]